MKIIFELLRRILDRMNDAVDFIEWWVVKESDAIPMDLINQRWIYEEKRRKQMSE